MFKLFVLLACISIISALPVDQHDIHGHDIHGHDVHGHIGSNVHHDDDVHHDKEVAHIVSSELNKNEDGSYHLQFSDSDGTSRQEDASVINAGSKDEALEVKGSYKYIDEHGNEVEVFYTAGKNGFVPHGSIINPEITAAAEAAKDLPSHDDHDHSNDGHHNNDGHNSNDGPHSNDGYHNNDGHNINDGRINYNQNNNDLKRHY